MHAVIEVASPADITLIDLGNEPGTLVNGQRVNKCKIRPGDQIQIGSTLIQLESRRARGARAPLQLRRCRRAPPRSGAAAGVMHRARRRNRPQLRVAASAGGESVRSRPRRFGEPPPPPANPFAGRTRSRRARRSVRRRRIRSLRKRSAKMPATAVTPSARRRSERAPGPYTYSMVKSGPDVSPDEVEVAHLASIEVMIMWDSNVLHVSHLTPPRSFYVGEEQRERRLRLLHPERDARNHARADRRRARRQRGARHSPALERLRSTSRARATSRSQTSSRRARTPVDAR